MKDGREEIGHVTRRNALGFSEGCIGKLVFLYDPERSKLSFGKAVDQASLFGNADLCKDRGGSCIRKEAKERETVAFPHES